MRPNVRKALEIAEKAWPAQGLVYDFGSFQANAAALSDLRPIYKGRPFVGVDMRIGPGVDVVADLHDLSSGALAQRSEEAEEQADTPPAGLPRFGVPGRRMFDGDGDRVLCLDTLEHVRQPWLAVPQLARVLARDGLMILAVPMNFHIHEHPHDYWRFTPDGLGVLLDLAGGLHSVTFTGGDPAFPHTVLSLSVHADSPAVENLQAAEAALRTRWEEWAQ